MDFSVVWNNLPYLLVGAWPQGPLGGAALTLLLSLASGLASAMLGLASGVWMSHFSGTWMSRALVAVLAFFRAIPVIMLIFWVYFLLPVALGLDVPALFTVVLALSLIGGAYLGHSVHSGIQSLPQGQWQAAQALGFTRWQTMRLVILPQALPMMLPSFINQWISLIKDTSLAYVIGVAELSFVATQVNNREVHPSEIFLAVACIYYLFCASLDVLSHWLGRIPPASFASRHRQHAGDTQQPPEIG